MKNQKKTNGSITSDKDKNDKGPFWMSPDRFVALTDGVFAITKTLRVLEPHAPSISIF